MIVLFGASRLGTSFVTQQAQERMLGNYFVDNDAALWGTTVAGLPVLQPIADNLLRAQHVIITSMWTREIYDQLHAFGVAHSRIWVPAKPMFTSMHQRFSPERGAVALEVLETAFESLEHTGLCVFIDCGTLLGLWRDSALIPWDNDIDVAVVGQNRSEHEQVAATLERVAVDIGIGTQVSSLDNSSAVTLEVGGITIPVGIDQSVIRGRRIVNLQNPHFPEVDIDMVMPLSRLPARPSIRVPNKASNYLEFRYGASWRTPTEQWAFLYGAHDLDIQVLKSLDQLGDAQ